MSLRDLEKELLAPKHWTLGGEVEGKQRPENALLDEDVQFPRKADVGREVREELLSMEDAGDDAAAQDAEPATAHDALLRIIKCRISAQAFDDVVYMQPPQKEKKLEDILSTVDTAKPTVSYPAAVKLPSLFAH